MTSIRPEEAGQRFAIPEPVGERRQATIRVVQNWFTEFSGRGSGPEE